MQDYINLETCGLLYGYNAKRLPFTPDYLPDEYIFIHTHLYVKLFSEIEYLYNGDICVSYAGYALYLYIDNKSIEYNGGVIACFTFDEPISDVLLDTLTEFTSFVAGFISENALITGIEKICLGYYYII